MCSTLDACDICGITSDRKRIIKSKKFNKTLCSKHYYQFLRTGNAIENSPLSCFDKNTYKVVGDTVYMDIRDKRQEIVCVTMFDLKFLDDIISRKWRLGYYKDRPYASAYANPDEPGTHITLHRVIAKLSGLDIFQHEIDHINGNVLDNRICNLREATRLEQRSNSAARAINKFGIVGVGMDDRYNKYSVDFCYNGFILYFKYFDTLEEAVYIRYLAEKHFYDDVALNRHLVNMQPYIDKLTDNQKEYLNQYFATILERKLSA